MRGRVRNGRGRRGVQGHYCAWLWRPVRLQRCVEPLLRRQGRRRHEGRLCGAPVSVLRDVLADRRLRGVGDRLWCERGDIPTRRQALLLAEERDDTRRQGSEPGARQVRAALQLRGQLGSQLSRGVRAVCSSLRWRGERSRRADVRPRTQPALAPAPLPMVHRRRPGLRRPGVHARDSAGSAPGRWEQARCGK